MNSKRLLCAVAICGLAVAFGALRRVLLTQSMGHSLAPTTVLPTDPDFGTQCCGTYTDLVNWGQMASRYTTPTPVIRSPFII